MNNISEKKSFDIYSLSDNKLLEKSVSVAEYNPDHTSRDKKQVSPKKAKITYKPIPYEYYYLAYRV